MEEKTRLPELTPARLRFGGIVLVVLCAAVPVLAWTFATSVVSLFGLLLAASCWAALALVFYFALGRSAPVRTMAVLVSGCAAVWTVLLSAGFWFLVRDQFGIDTPVALYMGKASPGDVMSLFGVAVAATGATYGFFSCTRYGALPRAITRSLRASMWASLPTVALSLAVFETAIVNRYAMYAIFAPFVLALAVTAVARMSPSKATG